MIATSYNDYRWQPSILQNIYRVNTEQTTTVFSPKKFKGFKPTKRFPTTVGIEFTFIANSQVDFRDTLRKIESKIPTNISNLVHEDDGCIEVPTVVLKSWKHTKKVYSKLFDIVSKFPIVNWHESQSLGGGHIHLGLQNIPKEKLPLFLKNIYTEMTNHPELHWVMGCPLDNEGSNSFACKETFSRFSKSDDIEEREFIVKLAKKRKVDLKHRVPYNRYERLWHFDPTLRNSKNYSLIYRPDICTLEFRFFESSRDWEELKLHLNIAFAMYRKCFRDTMKGILYPESKTTLSSMQSTSFNKAWRNFRSHMRSLKIDPDRAWRNKSNLQVRFKYGKSYLV